MQEWLNWHAWKACEPLKGSAGSNPALSAENQIIKRSDFFFLSNILVIKRVIQLRTTLLNERKIVYANNVFISSR